MRERAAQTTGSSAFVIWIRGNRKRWRSKLISNRVWKSIEGGVVSPLANRIQCLCFVSILFRSLEPSCSNLVRSRRIVPFEKRTFFFDNYSLDLFKVTVYHFDEKEKKLRENSRILLIFNWKNIRIIIEIIIVGFLNKYYLF